MCVMSPLSRERSAALSFDMFDLLTAHLKKYDRLAIAYSGGVDSSFLLWCAVSALGPDNVAAFTVNSVLMPAGETESAAEWARGLGVYFEIIDADPLSLEPVASNSTLRCYHCKKHLFSLIIEKASQNGFPTVADGSNADDSEGYRPGAKAARELGVVSPLRELLFHKLDIKRIANQLGISRCNAVSSPCLATRVPYNTKLTSDMLSRITRAENLVKSHGIKTCRVRVHGDVARIETDPADFDKVIAANGLCSAIRELGFAFVALDLDGYRSGSFDTNLKNPEE